MSRNRVIRRIRAGRRAWMFRTVGTVIGGAIGWAVDVTVLWILAVGLGVPTAIAAAAGLTASGAINFLINRVVHAGSGARRHRAFARYLVLFGVNLAITAVSVPTIATLLSRASAERALTLLGAKVIVTAVLLLVNSYAYHRWVFNEVPPVDESASR
jgi:putative flippase GtrA